MSPSFYCSECGAPLTPQARFCPKCGHTVGASSPLPAAPSYGPAPIPPTQKMDDIPDYAPPTSFTPQEAYPPLDDYSAAPPRPNRGRSWVIWVALVVILCCLVTVGLLVAAYLFAGDYNIVISMFATPTFTLKPPTPTPPHTPTLRPTATIAVPTQPPAVLAPTQPPSGGSPGLTSQQQLSDVSFFDDFSSAALDWPQNDIPEAVYGYAGGAYSMRIKVPDYTRLVRPPLRALTHLEFEAQVAQGVDNGLFGVACYFEDVDNRYEVDFDPSDQSLWFGRYQNGNWSELSDTYDFSNIAQPRKFGVDCTLGLMSAYVNDVLVAEVQVNVTASSREMWIFTATWSDADEGNFEVIYDNAYGYIAQQ